MSGGMEDTAWMAEDVRDHSKIVKEMHSTLEEIKYMKQLVADHWAYIEKVLSHSGNKSVDELAEIEFHYKSAFEHGFRHAKEYFTGSV